MNTPNGRAEIDRLFGHPAKPDGRVNPEWEERNIALIPPPPGWTLYYQRSEHSLQPTAGIRMHRLLKDSFYEVMTDIWNYARLQVKHTVGYDKATAEYDDLTRAWLHERCLDQHDGGYNFRPITGGHSLSLHSYGIAIDWDAAHNPRGNPMHRTLPDWWYDIWNSHGWSDGRHFQTADPMHVQFATGA